LKMVEQILNHPRLYRPANSTDGGASRTPQPSLSAEWSKKPEREALPTDVQVAQLQQRLAGHSQFLRTLAHEIGNSIVPIQFGHEILQRAGTDQSAVAQVCNMLTHHLPVMRRLVDRLRTVSQLVQGKMTVNASDTDLSALIE